MKRILILALLVIGGCKIKLEVPEGGSVETRSGLYACAPKETCYINVDHSHFDEEFFVKSEEGYVFDKWLKGDRYFCGDRQAACSLSTLGFAQNLDLMKVLSSSQEFHLVPTFRQSYYMPPASDDDWDMISFHSQVNYQVEGNSRSGIFDSIQSSANPLSFNPATGRKPSGTAKHSSYHRWTYRFDDVGCRVISFKFEATYETIMPQLSDLDRKTLPLQKGWRDWYLRLLKHEAGHHQIYRAQYAKQLEALKSMKVPWDNSIKSMSECAEAVRERRLAITRPISEKTRALDDEYHARVGSIIYW